MVSGTVLMVAVAKVDDEMVAHGSPAAVAVMEAVPEVAATRERVTEGTAAEARAVEAGKGRATAAEEPATVWWVEAAREGAAMVVAEETVAEVGIGARSEVDVEAMKAGEQWGERATVEAAVTACTPHNRSKH